MKASTSVRASDRAYATLLDEIQRGALRPGRVLGEVEQAARIGVSRTPLREALGRLAADGLVAQQSPRVTVVTAIDADDIRELFELRRALEEAAARLAAGRGDAGDFAALAEDFADVPIDGAVAVDSYYDLIARFDAAIDAAVANDYLTGALRTVRTHLVRVRRLARDNPDRLAASVSEHRLIASAIAAGDADLAAHATHVHLHNALTSVLASLDDASTGPATGGGDDSTGSTTKRSDDSTGSTTKRSDDSTGSTTKRSDASTGSATDSDPAGPATGSRGSTIKPRITTSTQGAS